MTRMAVVNSGVVENVIELEEGADWEAPQGVELVPDLTGDAEPGGTWNGSVFSRAPSIAEDLPPPVPVSISRSQLLIGLVAYGLITQQEAEDSSWAVPTAINAFFNNLPEEERGPARLTWLNFIEAWRADPLVLALATANGWTETDIDDAFIAWSKL